MNQISTIHINNFKFFGDSEPINVGGKHLLIYGENGSGKSSLFWALYTLLESVQKSDEKLIQYFTQGDDAGLVNIYAQPVSGGNWNSFISLKLSDDSEYRIAVDDFSAKARPNAQATQRGSDFLNYRFMFKLHDYRHKDEIDLLPLFLKEVFPYVSTRSTFIIGSNETTRPSQNFDEILGDLTTRELKYRFGQITETDYNKTKQEYARRVVAFADELNRLLADINSYGNQILQNESGLNYPRIRFLLNCPLAYAKDDRGKEDPDEPILPLRITLTIPEYDGMPNVIKRPQSFLNEAKLTAIGLAIRLAIIQRRADYARKADFQLLVLDDLLISLDMSNRWKVLDLLLTQYAPTYQLFILTHDRAFYEKTKRQISARNEEGNWQYFEMYEDTRATPFRPFIKKSDSHIACAEQHFINFDFPAAANYLRKACEQLLEEILPLRHRLDGNGEKIWQLGILLIKAEDYFKTIPLSVQPVNDIQEHLKTLLNPLSHADLESAIYRQELSDAFKSYHELKAYKQLQKLPVCTKGEVLTFELTDHKKGGNKILLEIKLEDDLKVVRLPEQADYLCICKYICFWSKDGIKQPEPIGDENKNDLAKFYKSVCLKTSNEPLDVLDALTTADGQPLRNRLNLPATPTVPTAE